MNADWTQPGRFKNLLIELKARQYRDPIQKLSYLQRAAARTGSPAKKLRIPWYIQSLFLVSMVLLGARMRTVGDVNAGLPREKGLTEAGFQGRTSPVPLGTTWLVEQGRDYDVYSNGLRIENRYLRPNVHRSYVIFRNGIPGDRHTNPAGIVFHTSESVQAPFESDQNNTLTRIGRDLLLYVSREQSYHFLIDRFGRVFRIVPETDVANHAGYSVWADQNGAYINLNHSFLGVSFEAQTRDINQGSYLNKSQIHSGHQLVEMLVSKYHVSLHNCVTHAQVSVDPNTMTIGHHTDGSGDFPFQELGIPDNYSLPIPSLFLFGFDYDTQFLALTGTRVWKGLILAEERLRREAALQQLPVAKHKEILREKYKTSIAMLKNLGIIKEN